MNQEATTENLLQAVLPSDNLTRACKRVKANRGAPGIDGVTVQDWPAHAREDWPALRAQTEGGRYQPQAVRRVEIPKPDGANACSEFPQSPTVWSSKPSHRCSRRSSIRRSRIREDSLDRRDDSVAAFKHRVKEMTGRSWGVSMDHRLHKPGQ